MAMHSATTFTQGREQRGRRGDVVAFKPTRADVDLGSEVLLHEWETGTLRRVAPCVIHSLVEHGALETIESSIMS